MQKIPDSKLIEFFYYDLNQRAISSGQASVGWLRDSLRPFSLAGRLLVSQSLMEKVTFENRAVRFGERAKLPFAFSLKHLTLSVPARVLPVAQPGSRVSTSFSVSAEFSPRHSRRVIHQESSAQSLHLLLQNYLQETLVFF